MIKIWWLLWISLAAAPCAAQIVPGAEHMAQYLKLLEGKRVAVFANQTSRVGPTHLVDTLLARGIRVVRIFSPEHGFRGNADAGEAVGGGRDSATGLDIVSLYGKHLAPNPAELQDVDVLVFDIQDVGVRWYTYISSLQYFLEAAMTNGKPLILLDRPNPNGFYVDGPVLDPRFKSFVGMQPIPVVYGMTLGEYAHLLIGQHWIDASAAPGFRLTVIPCTGYTHHSHYRLPVKPSPNLPNMQSVYLYPDLCLFEGTAVSVGRGTDFPFQCFGHPSLPDRGFSFTPRSVPGAKNPPLKDKTCYGTDLSGLSLPGALEGRFQLRWLLEAYRDFPAKDSFFNAFFTRLAGSGQLEAQLKAGLSEAAIRASWAPGIAAFKAIRTKYLIYPE
ncbi:exo-beta-N-acetylmuramidase NamZ family protein [Dinghuibacter silviterrae]|uniref:Uncharacterized protein YbbC (DUF1343 family) n=1 Tax=Dinghuibacter silviterrae TaxID=1539049 RepID=A0A4R8DE31_9BACT|nr:DUF1343 domain-containing protein [Dinghuibacter silviterrae]TDW95751.1 uncharacterized protein YbbC (DUF1343 family) [Dinghuibacter silviterrae]